MNLTPWQALFGATQGRAVPTGWTAPEGSYVFVLGSDTPGVKRYLLADDFVQVAQSGDLTGVALVRFTARLRQPLTMPGGASWRFELLVDGFVVATEAFGAGRTRDRFDMGALVGDIGPGSHELAFRLTLVGTPSTLYEVELPGVYVDEIVLETAPQDRPALINRDGEPDEVEIPGNALVQLEVVDWGGAGVDLAATDVYVNGDLAVDGGVFQPGYDGVGSAITGPRATIAHIAIAHATFPSLSTVTVRVVSAITGGGAALDRTYSFRIADTTAPVVASAMALDHQSILVTFDEPVLQESADGPGDALNPANWTLVLLGGAPAVTPEITAVSTVSPREVRLTTDIEMTRRATYAVVATSIEDLFGNAVAPPNDRAVFTGFVCPANPARRFTIYDFWTTDMRQEDTTGDLRALSEIWQEIVDLILCKIDAFLDTVADPDTAPEAWLRLMLADLGNPFPFPLTTTDMRRLISVLVPIYKAKGTDTGIIDAVRFFLGLEVTIEARWQLDDGAFLDQGTLGGELGGEGPGTFMLGSDDEDDIFAFDVVSPVVLDDEQRDRIRRLVVYMKRGGVRFRIVEPTPPVVIDHVVLGLSQLDLNFLLH